MTNQPQYVETNTSPSGDGQGWHDEGSASFPSDSGLRGSPSVCWGKGKQLVISSRSSTTRPQSTLCPSWLCLIIFNTTKLSSCTCFVAESPDPPLPFPAVQGMELRLGSPASAFLKGCHLSSVTERAIVLYSKVLCTYQNSFKGGPKQKPERMFIWLHIYFSKYNFSNHKISMLKVSFDFKNFTLAIFY